MRPRLRWPPRRLTLRTQLVLLGVAILLPVMLFASLLVWRLGESQRQGALRRLTHASRLMKQAVEREISGSVRVLDALAQSSHLARGDLRAFDDEARRVRTTQPAWLAVVLLRPDGQQLVNTLRSPGEPLPPAIEMPTIRELLRTGRPTISPASLTRGGQWAFAVRVPVRVDGEIRYVLTAAISTDGLSNVVASPLQGGDEWTRAVVDHVGIVLARSRSPDRFVGHPATPEFLRQVRAVDEGVYRGHSLEKAPVYVGFSRVQPSEWIAAVTTPVEAIDGPLRRSALAMGGLGLALFLLTMAGGYAFSRRVSGEIAAAASAATALAGGREPPPIAASVAEVARLGAALERSAALLKEREQERNEHLARAEAAQNTAEAAQRQAESSNRAKDEFLALLGHELRNPLAPIVTTLHIIAMQGTMRQRDLEILTRQSRHLARLVDDLLDVSRITRGAIEIEREPVNLRDSVDAAVEMAAPLVAERRHDLRVNVPREGLVVLGDRVRLAQVVSNLLNNAARYTPPGGRIAVDAAACDDHVELTVMDNGDGLPPGLAPRVFEMFVQGGRPLDRPEGGLGLGLAIVRSLVVLHGGTVEAESPGAGQGSTFRIRLPSYQDRSTSSASAVGASEA